MTVSTGLSARTALPAHPEGGEDMNTQAGIQPSYKEGSSASNLCFSVAPMNIPTMTEQGEEWEPGPALLQGCPLFYIQCFSRGQREWSHNPLGLIGSFSLGTISPILIMCQVLSLCYFISIPNHSMPEVLLFFIILQMRKLRHKEAEVTWEGSINVTDPRPAVSWACQSCYTV